MMASDRFPFSLRASLFLITWVAIPGILLGGTLDDTAGRLASEISAKMPAGTQASCEFANLSSLVAEDAAQLEQTLREALRSWCARDAAKDTAAADIHVTLSESWKEFVWTAQVRTPSGTAVLVETSPRTPKGADAVRAMPLALRADKIWEGPQRILDFTEIESPPATQEYWLLTDEGVVLRLVGRTIASQLQLSGAAPPNRDPMGELVKQGSSDVQVNFSAKICTIASDTFRVTECHPAPSTGGAASASTPNRKVRQRGSQSPFVEGACPFVRPILASGGGDYTQKDFIQLFDGGGSLADSNGIAVSAPLFFPGPVTNISGAEDLGIVVHNLDSENYEAYRVYISCAR